MGIGGYGICGFIVVTVLPVVNLSLCGAEAPRSSNGLLVDGYFLLVLVLGFLVFFFLSLEVLCYGFFI